MKSIAILLVLGFGAAAGLSCVAVAKTITASQGSANGKAVAGVAGPAAAANNSGPRHHKKTAKKAKIKAPPPLHDPD